MADADILSFYQNQLIILSIVCGFAYFLDRYVAKKWENQDSTSERLESDTRPAHPSTVAELTRKYLIVYAIVMGADWLQGPYVYSLYRDQYQFPERLVAVLFLTGFLSAGFAAPVVGVWADQHGRRKLCMVFCITYGLSCIAINIPSLPILVVGRFLAGFSTSILFSAFESWLISASSTAGLGSSELSTIFGRATLVNGIVATAAGVFSNQLVGATSNYASPFIASGCLLALAWFVIRGSWTENFGSGGGTSDSTDMFQVKRLRQAIDIVRRDPHLLVLGVTQTCFEGSMYLFVFLWVPSLQSATDVPDGAHLPFGYIFSAFMVSMMIGSVVYTFISSYARRNSSDSSLTVHAKLSGIVCAIAGLSFAMSVAFETEHIRFWTFCMFEACVGMYYPVQGMLRGSLISNEHRATVSSLFRIPLNIFVVVSLLTGVSSARILVLATCSLLLTFSSLLISHILVDKVGEQQQQTRSLDH